MKRVLIVCALAGFVTGLWTSREQGSATAAGLGDVPGWIQGEVATPDGPVGFKVGRVSGIAFGDEGPTMGDLLGGDDAASAGVEIPGCPGRMLARCVGCGFVDPADCFWRCAGGYYCVHAPHGCAITLNCRTQ